MSRVGRAGYAVCSVYGNERVDLAEVKETNALCTMQEREIQGCDPLFTLDWLVQLYELPVGAQLKVHSKPSISLRRLDVSPSIFFHLLHGSTRQTQTSHRIRTA